MFFIRLGITNAWRSLARSLYSILAIAIATSFLTYSVSLGRGYTYLYKADARTISGGEVMAYARMFGGTIPEGESRWVHHFLPESPLSDIAIFHPEIIKAGYLSTSAQKTAFTSEDLQQLASANPAPIAVYPRYQMPAAIQDSAGYRSVSLHGRDPALDSLLAKSPQEMLVDGRWFTSEDDGKNNVAISYFQTVPDEMVPRVGDIITMEIPRIIYVQDQPVFADVDPVLMEFTVIGRIAVVTRFLESASNPAPVYMELDEVQIPLSTWQQIWAASGGGDYAPEQASLIYDDLSKLEDIVYELRQQFPEFTLFSTPEHYASAEQRGLIERMTPQVAATIVDSTTPPSMPMDLRLPFSLLIFANAALVVAANLLIMVCERKKEIGVLKAVGATRLHVVLMIVGETLLISLVGASLGYVIFQFPAVLTMLTNQVNMNTMLYRMASNGILVYSVSIGFALVFGLMPGYMMSRLSVKEVLDNG